MDKLLQLRFQKCFDTHDMAYLEIQGFGSIDSIKAWLSKDSK